MIDDVAQCIAAFDAVMLFRVAHQKHAGANVARDFRKLVELLRGQQSRLIDEHDATYGL